MKPALFNAEMLRAVKHRYKRVTRRPIKPQPPSTAHIVRDGEKWFWEDEERHQIKLPSQSGDVLYVPEAWKCAPDSQTWAEGEYRVIFRDGTKVGFFFENPERAKKWEKYIYKPMENWQSPYFMPREAARIFLLVTDARVERLQDITGDQAMAEGTIDPRNRPYIQYEEVGQLAWYAKHKAFPQIWNSTIKPADFALYGWEANPFVSVTSFDRISKEDALAKEKTA